MHDHCQSLWAQPHILHVKLGIFTSWAYARSIRMHWPFSHLNQFRGGDSLSELHPLSRTIVIRACANCAGEWEKRESGCFLWTCVLCAMHAPVQRGNTRNIKYFPLNSSKETTQGVMIKSWKAEVSRDPTVLADAIEYRLSKLGY